MKYIFLFIIILGWSIQDLSAQNTNRPYRQYATQEVQQRLIKENPGLSDEMLKIERKISKNNQIGAHLRNGYIPMYFHILYSKEEDRVSTEQIMSQIEVLNSDFALSIQPDEINIQPPYGMVENGNTQQYDIKLNKNKRGDLDIKFCLAKSNGSNSSINYIPTQTETWGLDDALKFKNEGGSDAVQPNKYINVWIVNLGDQASGYAQLPGGPDKTDGIVIDYRFFGKGGTSQAPYDLGRTMTHLVGNYLGLHDLWNESTPCGDDQVADTPIHKNPNRGCPQYFHVSSCIPDEAEMTMNFMDNTDDVCQNMFTVGQMKRMYQMLAPGGPRNTLLSGASQCDLPEAALESLPEPAATSLRPQIQLSPNPAQGFTTLKIMNDEAGNGIGEVHIYSSLGRLVYSRSISLGEGYQELVIRTDQWPSGIYFLHVQVNEFKAVKSLSVVQN